MVNNGFEVNDGLDDPEGDQCAVYKHAKCGMRQVWFVTAMRGNKYQRRLTTLLQQRQIKIVIVTTGLFHSFKRMLI